MVFLMEIPEANIMLQLKEVGLTQADTVQMGW